MMRHGLPDGLWQKSSYSNSDRADCIEVQRIPGARIAVGDSKNRVKGAFVFSAEAWSAFIEGLKASDFERRETR